MPAGICGTALNKLLLFILKIPVVGPDTRLINISSVLNVVTVDGLLEIKALEIVDVNCTGAVPSKLTAAADTSPMIDIA